MMMKNAGTSRASAMIHAAGEENPAAMKPNFGKSTKYS